MNKVTKTMDVSEFSDAQIESMVAAGKLDPALFKELLATHEATKVFKQKAEDAEWMVGVVIRKLESDGYDQFGQLTPRDMAQGLRQVAHQKGFNVFPYNQPSA